MSMGERVRGGVNTMEQKQNELTKPELLNSVSTEPMKKTGEWVESPTAWKCSMCECESPHTYPHCPFCGSLMKLEIPKIEV